MSCAEVCLDQDYDCEPVEMFAQARRVARREWRCEECLRRIRAGEQYENSSGKSEGEFWSIATCLVCAEIRGAFVCGSVTFGTLWESIWDGMFPIWHTQGPIDCLAKLETKGARDYAMERYDAWRAEFSEKGPEDAG